MSRREASGTTSVVVLLWNSGEVALEAVASCLEQSVAPREVLVCDNASSDGVARRIAERFGSSVRVVFFESNLGYTGGHNRALRLAEGEHVLLLNPDARLAPDFLERALPAFDDERVGIVAGLLLRGDERTVDSSGLFLGRSRKTLERGFDRPYDAARDRPGPVLGACGAVALYRRAMIDDIADGPDFFDPEFFAYHEDLEISWRAWRAGWRALHVPEARATHLRAAGERKSRLGMMFDRPDAVLSHIVRNRYLTMLRHDRLGAVVADLPFVAGRDLALLALMLARRPAVLRALWRERASFARALERRRVDGGRRGRWGAWRREVPPRGVWSGSEGRA